MNFNHKQKRGISPFIAAVILIIVAVAIGVIVANFIRSYIGEGLAGARTQSVSEMSCATDVDFRVYEIGRTKQIFYEENLLTVMLQNIGKIDINNFSIIVVGTEGISQGYLKPGALRVGGVKNYGYYEYEVGDIGIPESATISAVVKQGNNLVVCTNVEERLNHFNTGTLSVDLTGYDIDEGNGDDGNGNGNGGDNGNGNGEVEINYTLSITISSPGTVTINPGSIVCDSSCSYDFEEDTSLTLTAEAGPGYDFSGWSGACSGTGSCSVVMTENRVVTADFDVEARNWKLALGTESSNDPYIYISPDSGETWTTGGIVIEKSVYAITSSLDGEKLAFGAYFGYIYTSTDGGETWTQRINSGINGWMQLTSSADGMKLATSGEMGGIHTSTDGGETWTERTIIQGNPGWGYGGIVSSADGMRLIVSNPYGYIYTSTDGGETWTERTDPGQGWGYKGLACSADGMKIIAGRSGGYIYTSTDGGETWTQRQGAGSGDWRAIASSADGIRLAAAFDGGYIHTSIDGGETWTERTSVGNRRWDGITSSSDGNKLAAFATIAGNSYIYTSIDGGETWTERTSAGNRRWSGITSSSG